MIFVFGGAYQGKKEFAEKTFDIKEGDERVINNLNDWIRGLVEDGRNTDDAVDALIKDVSEREAKESSGEIVIIMNDVSQGLVPMDPVDRAFREANGRAMIKIAAAANGVYRVFCGIGVKIK